MQSNMNYLGHRQDVLAQNIANANTPNYKAQDVKAPDFEKIMQSKTGVTAASAVGMVTSNGKHIAGTGIANNLHGGYVKTGAFEISPTGNQVVLEQEVMKSAKNSMEYQKTTNIYRKMLQMMKTAIGNQ